MKIGNKDKAIELCRTIENINAIIASENEDDKIVIGIYSSFACDVTGYVECDIKDLKPILQAKLDACMEELETL